MKIKEKSSKPKEPTNQASINQAKAAKELGVSRRRFRYERTLSGK